MADLKRFRKENNLTQIGAAEYFGCTQGFISQIERGERPIPDSFIEKAKSDNAIISANLLLQDNIACNTENVYKEGIPLYRTEAAAGFGTSDFAVEEKDIEARYKIRELESASFMLHVRGDSMTPNYNNGDIVALKKVIDNRSIQWGKPHLISSRVHGLLLKRIYEDDGHIIAVSDNPSYKPIYISKADITGIASVMGSIKFENYN